MLIDRRVVMATIPISLFLAGSAEATIDRRHRPPDATSSWDGTWSGNWGGQESQATSVTIHGNKVVSFEYRGVSTPVSASKVTPTTVSYSYNGVSVTLTRASATTAAASLHGSMGDATARPDQAIGLRPFLARPTASCVRLGDGRSYTAVVARLPFPVLRSVDSPSPPKPTRISAHVEGSGVVEAPAISKVIVSLGIVKV